MMIWQVLHDCSLSEVANSLLSDSRYFSWLKYSSRRRKWSSLLVESLRLLIVLVVLEVFIKNYWIPLLQRLILARTKNLLEYLDSISVCNLYRLHMKHLPTFFFRVWSSFCWALSSCSGACSLITRIVFMCCTSVNHTCSRSSIMKSTTICLILISGYTCSMNLMIP